VSPFHKSSIQSLGLDDCPERSPAISYRSRMSGAHIVDLSIYSRNSSSRTTSLLFESSLLMVRVVKGCVAFNCNATAELARFVEEHNIKPVIAKEFAFAEAREAFQALEKQNSVGKIVVKLSE
jgi:D-arabinose 1-dehydrogenase-like Zn-dependent alcohol dehydrogenase